ncbi:MAG: hypothetical protein ACXQS2_00350 [Methermicoccaceae archaeon]
MVEVVDLLGAIDYDKIKEKIKALIDANEFQVLVIDSAGNVVSDIPLSALLSVVATQPSFKSGQTTVGTTAVRLTSEPTPAKKGVVIKADDDNTGSVYIGKDNTVSTTIGFRLGAGQGITIEVDNASKIWLIADADNQKVHWIAV